MAQPDNNHMNHYNNLWVEKYRPQSLNDVILDEETKAHFSSLNDDTPHLLFHGPPGTGKSTMAKIIVKDILKCQYLYINASDENGVDTIRNKVISFAQTRSIDGKKKVVILEEADGLTGNSLDILRNVMEEYIDTTRFILTANYFNKILEPIRSRCMIFRLQPDIKSIIHRCIEILKQEKVSVEDSQKTSLLKHIEECYPDIRRTINDLQKYSISGKLIIKELNQTANLAKQIMKDLLDKVPSLEIRRKVIEAERSFNGEYQHLYKELFEEIYDNQLIKEVFKKSLMFDVGEYMYRDNSILDHEIGFFCCLVSMEETLKSK
jgi:DNA polymerase III delta prime subunit